MKRLISVLLTLVMMLSLMPAVALSGSAANTVVENGLFTVTSYPDSIPVGGAGADIAQTEENLAKQIHFTASFNLAYYINGYNLAGNDASGHVLNSSISEGRVEIYANVGCRETKADYALSACTDWSTELSPGEFASIYSADDVSIAKSGDVVTVSVDVSVAEIISEMEDYAMDPEDIEISVRVCAAGRDTWDPYGYGEDDLWDIEPGEEGFATYLMGLHFVGGDAGEYRVGGLTVKTPLEVNVRKPSGDGFPDSSVEYRWYYVIGDYEINDGKYGFPGSRSFVSFREKRYDLDRNGEEDVRAACESPFTFLEYVHGVAFGVTCGVYVSETPTFRISDIMDDPQTAALITAMQGRKPFQYYLPDGFYVNGTVDLYIACDIRVTYQDGYTRDSVVTVYDFSDGDNCILTPCPHACPRCGLCTEPVRVFENPDYPFPGSEELMGCQGKFDDNFHAAYCTCGLGYSAQVTDVTATSQTYGVGVEAVRVDGTAADSAYLESVFSLAKMGGGNVTAVYEINAYTDYPETDEENYGCEYDFSQGVTLTLEIGSQNAQKLRDGELCFYHLDHGARTDIVPDSIDVLYGTVTFTVDSFSPFLLAKEMTDPDLRFTSAGLRLDQNLNVYYKAAVPDGYENVRAEFTVTYPAEQWGEPYTEILTFTDWDYTLDGNGKCVFELTDLAPDLMGVEITARLYGEKNGTVYTAEKTGYSVKQYCVNMLAKDPDNTKLKNLLSDLLTYGAAAQTYTGSSLPLATAGVTGLTPGTFPGLSGYAPSYAGTADEDFAVDSAGLTLDGDVGMYFVLNNADYELMKDVTAEITVAGRTQTVFPVNRFVEALDEYRYVVSFDGINAAEFDEPVTIRLYYDGNPVGQMLTYSVNTYICAMQNAADANLQALVRALYCYGASAEAYAGEKTNKSRLVGVITDGGGIFDGGFNQAAYDAAADRCAESGVPFACYAPSGDSTAARLAEVERAVSDGCSILVLPGFILADVIPEAAARHPDVKFLALDAGEGDLQAAAGDTEYEIPANVYAVTFKEEIAGYLAGYAAVKLGYRNLGFLGGMEFPAVQRYGYGFLQGADAAADELNATGDVSVRFAYGNQFWGDDDITAYMDGWYGTGTQVVFACGGNIYTSAAEAAAKIPGAKVIGVDVDQADAINAYGEGLALTSAMKGVGAAVGLTLDAFLAGNWDDIGGTAEALPLVALPDSTQWGAGFTQSDCETFLGQLLAGIVTVSDDTESRPAVSIYVDYQGNIKQGDVFE